MISESEVTKQLNSAMATNAKCKCGGALVPIEMNMHMKTGAVDEDKMSIDADVQMTFIWKCSECGKIVS